MAAQKNDKEEELGVPFYQTGINIYLSLKVSKDRGSRKEDVEVLKGMYEPDKGRDAGWKIFHKVYGEKDDRADKPE
jgi:hypothetical protein